MSHNLCIEEGKVKLFYHGEPPWHGLGQRLNGPATAREAIDAAGLDWEVQKIPLFVIPSNSATVVPNRYAIVRSDLLIAGKTPKVLGIVGSSYKLLQNRDAFTFFDDLVGGPEKAVYHTAGALGSGERVWILAKLPGEMLVSENDPTEKYLLLSSSHDGESAIQLMFTPIRVVCQNTLAMALSKGPHIRIPHRAGLEERLRWAAETMGIISDRFTSLEHNFKTLENFRLDTRKAEIYFKSVFPIQKNQMDKPGYAWVLERMELGRKVAQKLFEVGAGSGFQDPRHTLWEAYNAVTGYVDHWTRHDSPSMIVREKHLNSIWFGEGNRIKTRALQCALELASSRFTSTR